MISFAWIPPFVGLALFLGGLWLLYRGTPIVLRFIQRRWNWLLIAASLIVWIVAPSGLRQEPDELNLLAMLFIGTIGFLAVAGPVAVLLMIRDFIFAPRPQVQPPEPKPFYSEALKSLRALERDRHDASFPRRVLRFLR